VQIKKSDDLDNACAKNGFLEAILGQAVAMQIILMRRSPARGRQAEGLTAAAAGEAAWFGGLLGLLGFAPL
jgi:hypothetical protein